MTTTFDTCPTCHGFGHCDAGADNGEMMTCPTCGGSGTVQSVTPEPWVVVVLPNNINGNAAGNCRVVNCKSQEAANSEANEHIGSCDVAIPMKATEFPEWEANNC